MDLVQSDPVTSEVVRVIVDAVNLHHVDPKTFSRSTPLGKGGLELDSVDVLEVVVAVEHHFDVRVSDDTQGRTVFQTIGTIAEFVQSQRKTNG